MTDVIINEQQCLSYLIHNPKELYKIAENYFLSDVGQAVFESLLILQKEGLSFTERHILKEASRISSYVNLSSISRLKDVDYDENKFSYYYKRLKSDYAKNEIQSKLLKEITTEISKKGDLDIEAVKNLQAELQRGIDLATLDGTSALNGKQMAIAYRSTIEARKSGKYKFSTGDSVLDKYLVTGASPQDMTTIFAATGMAKSTFAMNLVNKQINKQIPCLWVSPEMGTIASLDRLIAHRKKIPLQWLYPENEDDVKEQAFDMAEEVLQELEGLKYFAFMEKPSVALAELEDEIVLTKKIMGVEYLIVTIDLLTMIKEFSSGIAADIEQAMNVLHGIAKRQNVHIINVVQANRSADSAKVKNMEQLDRLRPKNLADIKNSGAIAERCRLVFSIFRPKHYAEKLFPEFDEVNLMDDELVLTILKQNQGQIGTQIKYLFDGSTFSCFPMVKLKAKRTKSGK